MKKLAAALLTMCLLLVTSAFAQNSPRATSTPPPVDKNQVIARLLDEVDEGRAYVAELERRQSALEAESREADMLAERQTEAYAAAQQEIGELRATIRHEKQALAERAAQVAALRADAEGARAERDEARQEAKRAKRENTFLKVGIVVAGLLRAVL